MVRDISKPEQRACARRLAPIVEQYLADLLSMLTNNFRLDKVSISAVDRQDVAIGRDF